MSSINYHIEKGGGLYILAPSLLRLDKSGWSSVINHMDKGMALSLPHPLEGKGRWMLSSIKISFSITLLTNG